MSRSSVRSRLNWTSTVNWRHQDGWLDFLENGATSRGHVDRNDPCGCPFGHRLSAPTSTLFDTGVPTGHMSKMADRFTIEIGREDYANHIIDMNAGSADSTDQLVDLPTRWDRPGELMCSHGHRWPGAERMPLEEYAAHLGVDNPSFEGDPLEGICSYCWSNTIETITEHTEHAADGILDQIGEVGYRLRWKQKYRAREEWYDIVVRPATTMAELDSLVCRFTTLDTYHLRMYGLEDEYMDSSITVVPDDQYEYAGNPSDTRASEMTIGEVAERATLWEDDRLSLVYDFGTPSHYYCIVKEIYEPEEIDTLLDDSEPIAATDTAAIIKQKRP
jgi:hypothetical protein